MWFYENMNDQSAASDESPETPPSATVALRLSDVLEKDVTDIEPLGNKIDTDALNRLCQGSLDADFRFEFRHEGCLIEIEEDQINVSKLDRPSD